MSRKKSKKNTASKIRNFLIAFASVGIILPLVILYLYPLQYYKDHFYKNTSINGIDTSNMTVEEAEALITEEVRDYKITLVGRNGISDTIRGGEINLHMVYEGSILELLQQQDAAKWPLNIRKPHDLKINTMLEYDEKLLEKKYNMLALFEEANIIEPTNATISEYGENGYEIVPEDPGAKINKDELYPQLQQAILTLAPTLVIEDTGTYAKPEKTSEYPDLANAFNEMKDLTSAVITYEFGDDIEVLDGKTISNWITLDDNYKVEFNEEGIKEYVDYIGKTYNSFGRVRTFKTSYGDTIEVKGGDYGWWLNRPEEVKELTQLIKDGETVTKKPVYFQTAQQYGKDDIGNTYVEVNLTAQHLYFYKNGELVVESDFVSGNVSKNYSTPVGTYPIQYKENDAVLVGEDYQTPVKYWMPFNRNIGFHDANWRNKFGEDIYLTKGSHGCINMPPAAAKTMFAEIQRGVAVVVYELPGTENYDVDKDKDKDKGNKDTTQETNTSEETTGNASEDTSN